jgi:hypothetical protein
MWKETAVRFFIGIAGMAVGALFVLMLQGAAQAGAERLRIAQERANTVVAAATNQHADEAGTRVAHIETQAPGVP